MWCDPSGLTPGDLITFEAGRVFLSLEDAKHDYGRADREHSNASPKVAVVLGEERLVRVIRDYGDRGYFFRLADEFVDDEPYAHLLIVFCEGKNMWISLDHRNGGDRLRIKKLS